jgi:hypothetical protein
VWYSTAITTWDLKKGDVMKVVTIRMILALTFFCFGMAISQMTITEQDLAGLDGSTGTYEITTTGNVPVDMKQAAPNQVWDFTNVNFSNETVEKPLN